MKRKEETPDVSYIEDTIEKADELSAWASRLRRYMVAKPDEVKRMDPDERERMRKQLELTDQIVYVLRGRIDYACKKTGYKPIQRLETNPRKALRLLTTELRGLYGFNERICGLVFSLKMDELSVDEQVDATLQSRAMRFYLDLLQKRINRVCWKSGMWPADMFDFHGLKDFYDYDPETNCYRRKELKRK